MGSAFRLEDRLARPFLAEYGVCFGDCPMEKGRESCVFHAERWFVPGAVVVIVIMATVVPSADGE